GPRARAGSRSGSLRKLSPGCGRCSCLDFHFLERLAYTARAGARTRESAQQHLSLRPLQLLLDGGITRPIGSPAQSQPSSQQPKYSNQIVCSSASICTKTSAAKRPASKIVQVSRHSGPPLPVCARSVSPIMNDVQD